MNTAAIIQSRYDSARLPGKALMDIAGKPMIQHVIERALMIEGLDLVVVAILVEDLMQYNALAESLADCKRLHWYISRIGNSSDVVGRFERAALAHRIDNVMRITGDCPLLCPFEAARVLKRYREVPGKLQPSVFVTNDTNVSGTPDGFDVEVFHASWLVGRHADELNDYDREHVTSYIRRCATEIVVKAEHVWPEVKLSVDTQEDLDRVRKIYENLNDGEYQLGATLAAWTFT
jgi:spore coat polysaccharide biosynthesis protein SpsF (cytidylyltransferase family)